MLIDILDQKMCLLLLSSENKCFRLPIHVLQSQLKVGDRDSNRCSLSYIAQTIGTYLPNYSLVECSPNIYNRMNSIPARPLHFSYLQYTDHSNGLTKKYKAMYFAILLCLYKMCFYVVLLFWLPNILVHITNTRLDGSKFRKGLSARPL